MSNSSPPSPEHEPEVCLGSDSVPIPVSSTIICSENTNGDVDQRIENSNDGHKRNPISVKAKLKQYQRRKGTSMKDNVSLGSSPSSYFCALRTGTENANDGQRKDSIFRKDELKKYQRRKKSKASRDNDVNWDCKKLKTDEETLVRVFDTAEEEKVVVSVSTEMDAKMGIDEIEATEKLIMDINELGSDEIDLVSIETPFGGSNQSVFDERIGEENSEKNGKKRLDYRIPCNPKRIVDESNNLGNRNRDAKGEENEEWILIEAVATREKHLVVDALDSLLRFGELDREQRIMMVKPWGKKAARGSVGKVDSESAPVEQKEEEADMKIEDEEEPYYKAMKIIMGQNKVATCRNQLPRPVPSLQDLCLKVFAENPEASYLECLPDEMRNKLCQLVEDSGRMDLRFVNFLVRGSPSQIRISDCSFITKEEQLLRIFEKCDTKNLTVLQLDRSCMSDYVLYQTLAQSPNSLPVLTSISLYDAPNLSDLGINAIVRSAPALRCVDFAYSSLSFLGIETLADSLGHVLKELHLGHCKNINALKILPALEKLKMLEAITVAGIETVSDDFVCKFIPMHGSKMKELVLADCRKLTDTSMKVIGENCHQLRVLNVDYLDKLTDYAMRYLANGCQSIQNLKLRLTNFSDEAIAAFLEAAGESLTELSLNSVMKVSHKTAISIANRCSRNLSILDLTWCYNLVDKDIGLILDTCSNLTKLKICGRNTITKKFLDVHPSSIEHIVI